MNWDDKTISTYNKSAESISKYFKGIGSRVVDIERALQLAGSPTSAKVVEIGCGDGRDATEIIKRASWYEGFDPSDGLLKLARQNLPQASFVMADALTYAYPDNVDVVYAFASLLHINKEINKRVFEKVAASLRPGGIFYISLKERGSYTEEVKKDEYGERIFYFYNAKIIEDIASDYYEVIYKESQLRGKTEWFNVALKRK